MKKSNLITVSAAVLLLSLQSAAAQVCTTPPTCDALGYTKSASECGSNPMLKCPLDQTKVFCAGSSTPTTPTYSVGDIAPGGGTIVAVNSSGTGGTRVVSAGAGTYDELKSYCASLSGGGTVWQIASSVTLEKMNDDGDLFFSGCSYYYHSGKGYCHLCGGGIGSCSSSGSQSTAGGYCEAPF